MTEPTPQDIANSAYRASVAARERAQYDAARALADSVFGEGTRPTGLHYLIDAAEAERCRKSGEKPEVVARVITVTQEGKTLNLFVMGDTVKKVRDMNEGLDEMLKEKHPTLRRDWSIPGRYELYWAGFYAETRVKSPEQLATARVKRQAKAVAKEATGSLFSAQILEEGFLTKGQSR